MKRPDGIDYFANGDGVKKDRPYDYIEDLDKYIDYLEGEEETTNSDPLTDEMQKDLKVNQFNEWINSNPNGQ